MNQSYAFVHTRQKVQQGGQSKQDLSADPLDCAELHAAWVWWEIEVEYGYFLNAMYQSESRETKKEKKHTASM